MLFDARKPSLRLQMLSQQVWSLHLMAELMSMAEIAEDGEFLKRRAETTFGLHSAGQDCRSPMAVPLSL